MNIDIADQVRGLCEHDNSGFCECTAHLAGNEIERLRKMVTEAFNAGVEASAKVCEEHAADTSPPFKPYEDNYMDGWLNASNECGWAIRELEIK